MIDLGIVVVAYQSFVQVQVQRAHMHTPADPVTGTSCPNSRCAGVSTGPWSGLQSSADGR